MEPEIGQTYMFLTTAEDIWEAIGEIYSNLGNSTQIYEVKTLSKVMKVLQRIITLSKGYGKNLNLFYEFERAYATDSTLFKMLEKELSV